MFDPTAFDNMKVVIEGALYDFDLSGEIIITDRNDIINMAKMSRSFDLSFQLPAGSVTARIEMESKLVNLAAELLPSSLPEKLAGSYVKLQFFLKHLENASDFQAIETIFLDIWGEKRKITQYVEYNPLNKPRKIKNTIAIDFERIIGEEQMDDLIEMTDFMVTTMEQLQAFMLAGNRG
ncbi:hypothetical protein ACIFOT_03110 [Neobacillus sp. NRS-1170]|uniref:hypothetical protein n=1 Tax=Neobacillus sp. NRS-1170 TaxID=3233898 RepID=UPI003D27E017